MFGVCRNKAPVALIVLVAVFAGCGNGRVLLKPGTTEVVIAPDAVPVVRFAAEEMTNFLSRAFGAAVPLVTEPTPGRTSVVLGDNRWSRAAGLNVAKLARDGYCTLAKDGRLYLAGRDDATHDPRQELSGKLAHFHYEHATLFAVYGFLEKSAEVGFYFPGEIGTVVPRTDSVAVPEGLSVDEPVFPQRYYSPMRMGEVWTDPELTKNEILNLFMLRGRFGTYRTPNCHGQRSCRYVERFAKDHPDWFCLQENGKRHLTDTYRQPYWRNGKLCYTSPIREEIYEDAKAYLSGRPASSRGLKVWSEAGQDIPSVGRFFDMMPEDGFLRCHCANCEAAAVNDAPCYERDIMWGLAAEMGNRLIKDGVPGMLTLSSYFPYDGYPSFDLPSNILVTVSLKGPWIAEKTEAFAEEVDKAKWWCEKTKTRVVTWSYPGKYPGMNPKPDQPQIAPRAWAKYYKAFVPYIQGGYAQCDTDRFIYDVLNLQVYAHVAWDADFDVEAYLDRFYRQVFEDAAAPMKKAFDLLEDKWMNGICGKPFEMGPFGPALVQPSAGEIWQVIYGDVCIRDLRALFDAAAAAVPSGSRAAKAVALMRAQVFAPLERRNRDLSPAAELERRAKRAPRNILKSGSCDDVAGWSMSGAGATQTLDTADKVEGSASLRLQTSSAPGKDPYCRVVACQNFNLDVGSKYRLSYFIKSKDVVAYKPGEGASLCLLFGPEKGYQKHPIPLLTGSCDWMHQELVFTATEPKNRLEARICASTGTLWVDGLLLEKIEAPADATAYEALKKTALARPRGLVYNTDGCDVLYWPTNQPVSVEAFKNRRLAFALKSRITTISYCPQSAGFGHFTCRKAGEPLTNTVTAVHHGNPSARNAAQDFFDLGTDALEMTTDFCRSNNLEVFVSLRMNDQHDASSSPEKGYNALYPQFKKDHPECLMGAFGSSNTNLYPMGRCNWSCVNFACEPVRREFKRFVRQFLENYDVDGMEFDFNRHCVLFKSVVEGGVATDAERALMTDLMREVRAIAHEVGRHRGRYFVLAMRSPDSLGFNRDVGIDLARWFELGLVDIWIGSGYFRLTPWEESVALAHKHGVKFYASIDESRIGRGCARNGIPCIRGRESLPAYSAAFANALAAGVDGCYLFNREGAFLNEIANLDVAPNNEEDKLYFVRYRGSDGYLPEHWLHGGSRHDRLPKLDPGFSRERDFPKYRAGSRVPFELTVGDDLSSVARKPRVTAKVLTNLAGGELVMEANGRTHRASWSGNGQFHFSLEPDEIVRGVNRFAVTFPDEGAEMTINDFALEVRYPPQRGKLLLSFDDRNFPGWEKALPLFERYDARATFFLCGKIDGSALAFMRTAKAAGHSLGLHGFGHQKAPKAVKELGSEGYVRQELLPQVDAARAAGFEIGNFGCPYSDWDKTCEGLWGRYFSRVRSGHLHRRDPAKDPLTACDRAFAPSEPFAARRVVPALGIGDCSATSEEELRLALRRMHDRNESLLVYAHKITDSPKPGDMSPAYLERILSAAQSLGVAVVGYDEVCGQPLLNDNGRVGK